LCKKTKGKDKILSFTLYELLSDQAKSETDRSVKTQESAKLYKTVNKPILEALDALEKDKVKTETITDVIDAFLT
jgi:hypothetical protein